MEKLLRCASYSPLHTPKLTSIHNFELRNPNIHMKWRTRKNNNALVVNASDGGGGGGEVDTAVVEKDKPKVLPPRFQVLQGSPMPFGATAQEDGVNFAIYSRNATSATLCLMTPSDLPEVYGYLFCMFLLHYVSSNFVSVYTPWLGNHFKRIKCDCYHRS